MSQKMILLHPNQQNHDVMNATCLPFYNFPLCNNSDKDSFDFLWVRLAILPMAIVNFLQQQQLMMLEKIEQLISEIQVGREKSRDSVSESSSETRRYSKKWSDGEENLLCDLIVRFGTDFTLLQDYFPHKTRKQIKKKYKHIFEHRQRKLIKIQNEFQKERRKSFFDEEIMEENRNQKQHSNSDVQQQSFF